MSDELTMAEIESRYDGEWVLIGDPVTNDKLEVLSGKVLFHSKDRDEVHRKAVELRPKRSALFYIGTIPAGTAIWI
jgi:hypothetical protein